MVLKTHLEPFREPLKVPPVGQPKNFFFLWVYILLEGTWAIKGAGVYSPYTTWHEFEHGLYLSCKKSFCDVAMLLAVRARKMLKYDQINEIMLLLTIII